MAQVPYPITENDAAGIKRQVWNLIRDLYEERMAGLNIGDVFADSGDVLELQIADAGGLEKVSNELRVKVSPTGGILRGSQGLATSGSTLTGTIHMWPTSTVPGGFLECNGASLLRSVYADLFAVISDDYGAVDGSHFNLPDYRGCFLRGWAHGSTNDPDRASRTDRGDGIVGDNVGTEQAGEVIAHTHGSAGAHTHATDTTDNGGGPKNRIFGGTANNQTSIDTESAGTHAHASVGGNETRPININVMFIIKY